MTTLTYARQDSFAGGMVDWEGNALPADACEVIVNMRVTPGGKLRRRGASEKIDNGLSVLAINATRGLSLVNGTVPNGSQWLLFGHSSGTPDFIHSDNEGALWTSVTSLAGRVAHGTILAAGAAAKAWLTVPDSTPWLYSWDGATASAATGAPANANLIAAFNDRLWIVPTNSDTLYASQVAAAGWDTDQGAFTVPVLPDEDGTPIVALLPLGDELLVFRRRSVSRVTGYGEQSLVVAEGSKGVSRAFGAIDGASVIRVDGGRAMWCSERGIEMYAGGQVQLASLPLQRYFEALFDGQSSPTVAGGFDPLRTEARFAVGWQDSRWVEYVYNTRVGAWALFSYTGSGATMRLTPASGGATGTLPGLVDFDELQGALTTGTRPTYFTAIPNDTSSADYPPYLCHLQSSRMTRLDASEGDTDQMYLGGTDTSGTVQWWVRTRPETFGVPEMRKRAQQIQAVLAYPAADSLGVNVRAVVDGDAQTVVALNVANPGDAARKPVAKLARVNGRGYTVQADVYGAHDATLNGVAIGARLLDTRVG